MKNRYHIFVVGLIFIWSGIKIIHSALFERKGFLKTIKSLHELFDNYTINHKEKLK